MTCLCSAIHHDLPLLRYKTEIEILEIQDWNDSGSSDDSGTLPAHVRTDSDDEDHYPGIHQNSHSHPLPWQTIFWTPWFGDGPGNLVGWGGGPSSGAPADCTSLGGLFPSPMHFGTSLPMGQLPLRSFPLRSGSSSSARHRLPAVRRSPKSVVVAPGGQPPRDDAAILVDAGCSTLVDVRTFDPMINESEDYPTRLRLRNLEVGDGLPARHDVLLSNPLEDPMLLELELLSAPSSPATGMDEVAPVANQAPPASVDLELVHFDVQDPGAVVCASPSCAMLRSPEGRGKPSCCTFLLMPTRWCVRLSLISHNLCVGKPPAGVERYSTPSLVAAAATSLLHQAQREAGKKSRVTMPPNLLFKRRT
jgi:hypothetical protein